MHTVRRGQGRRQWRPRSRRRWRRAVRWRTRRCASAMSGQAKGVFLFWTRWAAVIYVSQFCVILFVQILPDVPEPPVYWIDTDPRAQAAHMGIITQMVLDFQPLSLVNNKGFLIDKRLTLPSLQVHTPWWYQDKIEKVNHHLMTFNLICKLPTLYLYFQI